LFCRKAHLGESRGKTANSRRPAVVLEAGEESGSARGESGELPDSGVELAYCKPELKEQGPKKNRRLKRRDLAG
jgi:hypothetical protein